MATFTSKLMPVIQASSFALGMRGPLLPVWDRGSQTRDAGSRTGSQLTARLMLPGLGAGKPHRNPRAGVCGTNAGPEAFSVVWRG